MINMLCEPYQIGRMKLKNRIVMPAMALQHASKQGCVTQRMKDYYEACARG